MKRISLALIAVVVLTLIGCNEGAATRSYVASGGGDAQNGKRLVRSYGCGACHVIPGVRGARGMVGPPLYFLSQRTMIAGELPNTPANLALWIEHPRQVEPKTAMPDLGLTEYEAYDIVAYLYTLHGPEGPQWFQ